MTDLTSAMGIQKASLYDTYGDKRKLFLSAFSKYAEDYFVWLQSLELTESNILDRFHAYAWPWVDETTQEGKGCFFVNTAIELAPHEPEIAHLLEEFSKRAYGILTKWATEGQCAGQITAKMTPEFVSQYVVSVRIGVCTLSNRRRVSEFTALDELIETGLSPLKP